MVLAWGTGEGRKQVLFPFFCCCSHLSLWPDGRGEPGVGSGVRLEGKLGLLRTNPAVGLQGASGLQHRACVSVCMCVTGV